MEWSVPQNGVILYSAVLCGFMGMHVIVDLRLVIGSSYCRIYTIYSHTAR